MKKYNSTAAEKVIGNGGRTYYVFINPDKNHITSYKGRDRYTNYTPKGKKIVWFGNIWMEA